MIYACTGHRPKKLNNEYNGGPMTENIKSFMRNFLVTRRPEMVISGGALGVDQMWAEVAIELEVPVIMALPFQGFEGVWPPPSQAKLERLLNHDLIKEVLYVSEPGWAAWKMQKRNQYMVDNSDLLVAIWDKGPGGTANCVEYARKKDRQIIHFNPFVDSQIE